MSSPKLPPASLRYFKARLKPLANPLFWAPPTILALLTVSIWQYQQHPEWLNTALDQPEAPPTATNQAPSNPAVSPATEGFTSPNSGVEDWNSLASALDPPTPAKKTDPADESAESESPAFKSLFDQMQEKQKNQQPNQLFAPLLPNNNSSSNLLDRAALRDNQALLQGSPQGTNSSPSNPSSIGQPGQPSSLLNSPVNSRRNSGFASALQQAVERAFGNSNSAGNPNQTNLPAPTNANNSGQTTNPTGVPPTANPYPTPSGQATVPNNYYNPPPYLGQRTVNPGQSSLPNNVPGGTAQNFNQVNQPRGINRAYFPTNPGLQPVQTPAQLNQSTQSNNYNTLPNPYPYSTQQNSPIQTPNIQQPIDAYPPEY